MALAVLPVAHGLDRHLDLLGEGGLRETATRPHLTHELCRIAVIDRLLGSIGQNFHDPPIRFQPHPHHGRTPSLAVSANALPDSRLKKVNATAGLCWPRLCPKVSKGARRRRPKEGRSKQARQSHSKVIDWAKRTAKKIATGKVAAPTIHLWCVASKPNEANRSRPRTENE